MNRKKRKKKPKRKKTKVGRSRSEAEAVTRDEPPSIVEMSEPEIDGLIASNANAIEEIVNRYDPIELIAAFRFLEVSIDANDYTESTHLGQAAAVDYVASLAAKKSYIKHQKRLLEPSDLSMLRDISHYSLALTQHKFHLKAARAASDSDLAWISAAMATNSLVVRGHSYPHHLLEILKELAESVDDVVQEVLGFSLTDAITIDDGIFELEVERLEFHFTALDELQNRLAAGRLHHNLLAEQYL